MKLMALINNPQFLAALRNMLSALGGALAILGITYLTPDMITKIMELLEKVGVIVTSIGTILALVLPSANALIASWKASPINQIKSAAAVANDPAQPGSNEVKIAMMNETAKLPEVDRVVAPEVATDARTETNVTVS